MRHALLAPLVALALVFLPAAYTPLAVPAGPWTSYTPTLTANGTAITTRGTSNSRYQLTGKTLDLAIDEAITTNGAGTSPIQVGLPAGMVAKYDTWGTGWSPTANKVLLFALSAGTSTFSVYIASDLSFAGGNGSRVANTPMRLEIQ